MLTSAVVIAITGATGILATAGDLPAWAGGPITAGLVAGLLITGQLVPGKMYRDAVDERQKAQEREREAISAALPVVEAANGIFTRVLDALPPAPPARARAR